MKTTGNKAVLFAGVLGSIKLLTEAYGYSIITDDQINAIVNGLSAVVAVIAAFTNNFKHKTN
ncbi:hypothetical protein O0555_21225 [Brevibacillus laterosporus]|uniref:hypothetical protein n=1 Tax=Brevibacillus laterosporus TaxID=1465 RepID=UPI000C785ACF|nr:hypothetical protein [Brevibacillus laterosporus]AUM64331.1 hypothetical protein C0R09_07170 [Brevibacillus laterosporus]MCR8939826.1 hypothetical protein [Brevibacillus laterosporus]MCZ0842466.1 hypothetical protein [Brevibacillus laterosporus]MCZ0846463.1 hypothetical protein [Brevibacillus laterosporus]